MAFHIIGDQDTVLGFSFAGVDGSVVDTESEALAAFRQVAADRQIQILLVTEHVEAMLGGVLTEHRLQAVMPYSVVVEDIWGPKGERRSLEELIYEAVGIRISKDGD